MISPRAIGAGAGLLSTFVAAASNLRRGDPHLVSAAPDLLTLVAVVAVVSFAVRRAGAQHVAGRESAQKATVVASTVFALGMGAFTLWYLPSHALVLGAFGAGSGFVLAYLAGLAASRTIQKRAV
jgi:hypothetical protein